MSKTSLPLLAAFCALVAAPPLAAQNLIVDPHFDDSGLANWSGSGATFSWNALDATGTVGSGSLLVTNPGCGVNCVQGPFNSACLAVPGALPTYNIGGKTWVPSGQAILGRAWVAVDWYTDASCTVSGGTFAGAQGVNTGPFDTWVTIATSVTPPAGTQSARVFIGPENNASPGSFQVYFDDVYFGIGITPVTLTRFAAR